MVQLVNLGNTQAVKSNSIQEGLHNKSALTNMAMSSIRYGDEEAGFFSKIFGGIKGAISWFFGGIKSFLLNWILCGLCNSETKSGPFKEMSVVEAKASHAQVKALIEEVKQNKEKPSFQAQWKKQFDGLNSAVQNAIIQEYLLTLAGLKGLNAEEAVEYADKAMAIKEDVEKAKKFVYNLEVARRPDKPELKPFDEAYLPKYLNNVRIALERRTNS